MKSQLAFVLGHFQDLFISLNFALLEPVDNAGFRVIYNAGVHISIAGRHIAMASVNFSLASVNSKLFASLATVKLGK